MILGFIHRLSRNVYLRQNILVFLVMNFGNVFNYLFQVLTGRYLGPEDYGAFNSLNSLAVLLSTPLVVLPVVLSRYAIEFKLLDPRLVRELFRLALRFMSALSLAVLLLGLASLPWIQQFLAIDQPAQVLFMLLFLGVSFILPVPTGMLMGLQRFMGYALSGVAPMVFRFLGGVVLVAQLGLGVGGALLSGVIGTGVGILAAFWFLKDIARGECAELPEGTLRRIMSYAVPVGFSSLLMLTLGNLDLILVRHYCALEDSGRYAMASVLGRIAYYVPGMLSMVLFPSVATSCAKNTSGAKALITSLLLTSVLSGGYALLCIIFAEPIISLLYGPDYLSAATLLRLVTGAMALLAIVNLLVTYCLASSRYGYMWILGLGVAAMLVLINAFHEHAEQVAMILLGTVFFILCGSLVWFMAFGRRVTVTCPD
jgi:O-antigen/teichoic acid export membrane protein